MAETPIADAKTIRLGEWQIVYHTDFAGALHSHKHRLKIVRNDHCSDCGKEIPDNIKMMLLTAKTKWLR